MTTVTVTQGYLDQSDVTVATSTTTWADLSTWSAYTDWNDAPNDVVVRLDDDQTTSDYYVPTLEIVADGSVSVSLKTSDTGAFAGEEATINFAIDTEYDLPKARYWRWIITVSADSNTPVPSFVDAVVSYNQDYVVEVLDDVDIPSAGTNSAGDSLVTTSLSVVKNVQATTLQGGLYVEDGYVIPLHNAASGYYRTPRTVNNNGVTLDTTTFKHGTASLNFDGTDYMSVPQVSSDLNDLTGDFTFEMWVYPTNIGTRSEYIAGGTWFFMQLQSSGEIQFRYETDTEYILIQSTTTLTNNTWHHVAATHDTSAKQFRLWINGNYQPIGGSDTDFYTGTTGANSDPLIIGDSETTATDHDKFTGKLDDIRWSTVDRYGLGTGSPVSTPTRLYNDPDTILLLSDALTDDGDINYGTDGYFYTQRGGSAVVESKAPLALRVVDYNGDAWDGTVDLVLRGYPSITYEAGSVGPVEI